MMTTKILAVLLTVIGTTTLAADKDSAKSQLRIIPKVESSSYKLIYQSQKAEPVFVSIKDEHGATLVTERYKRSEGFILPVNFEDAKTGTYHVEVKGKTGSVAETIKHISRADYLKTKLFLQVKDGLVGIAGYDLGKTKLSVVVYNDKSEQVYNEVIRANGVLSKQYNFQTKNSEYLDVAIYHGNSKLTEKRIKKN